MKIAVLNDKDVINIVIVDNVEDIELINSIITMNGGTSFVEADETAYIGGQWTKKSGFTIPEVNNV